MTKDGVGSDLSLEEIREKYRVEREKRLRPDANAQYKELRGEFAAFDRDPYVEPGFTRDPVVEQTEVVIVGAGFAGMLTAINLTKLGIRNFRVVEKAGDFGGTWYWNRYPGCMCDVESYTYLPLLEETGYMPTEKYASAPEIFGYCQLLGRTFDLYRNALFQTVITDIEWDDQQARWHVTTSRGDRLSAHFVVLAGGILHKAKLPGIPGIEGFTGKAFHTSRWDYAYTGGGPRAPLEKLADKRVGIIGTGATAVQAVPQLAHTAKELYVFQRTPSAVGVRNNGPTDLEWWKSLKPGWQAERIVNFTHAVTGARPEQDLVHDGWTEVMWVDTRLAGRTPEEAVELERSDFETTSAFRRRIDELVEDPELAEKLKPWYG
jgi:cyclohexanone monooxygenase